MNEHNVCPWCGEVGRATSPISRRSFRTTHEETCGASGNLDWLSRMRARWGITDHLDAHVVDLREDAFSGA